MPKSQPFPGAAGAPIPRPAESFCMGTPQQEAKHQSPAKTCASVLCRRRYPRSRRPGMPRWRPAITSMIGGAEHDQAGFRGCELQCPRPASFRPGEQHTD